jgi:DNA integrity scanning protein DisA with diadenylate cyclase activity
MGTRHRAALGITEQTDAIVILVSEETGDISVASNGHFIPIVNRERLVASLKTLLIVPKKKK